MSVQRVYQKTTRTPAQLAELRAVREKYQREKPSLEQAAAESGQPALPLGEVILIRHVLSLLKRERERQKLTLAQLEERTGIAQAALSRLESGKTANPTIDTIYRISTALGKTVTCFMQDAPAPAKPAAKAKRMKRQAFQA